MTSRLRVLVEQPTRGKRWVAIAADWPGLERGGKTEDEAVEKLARYVPRYLPVAKRVRLGSELAAQTAPHIIGRYPGVGSTDFWGISFGFSEFDHRKLTDEELERELALLHACWAEFDDVRARASAELKKGPRGGGRDRDRIVHHVMANEHDWTPRERGVKPDPDVPLEGEALRAHRENYLAAIRALHAEGRTAGKWPVRFLIRHTAFHTMDHAWEMEDKDLTGAD